MSIADSSPVGSDPPRPPHGLFEDRRSFLLTELAVETPLDEVRRVLTKKLRAFETEEGGEKLEAYRRAFQLIEQRILERMGGKQP